ncbi:uncharacterized protein [Diadema antillarum]|uniref:uncharacterized protein n=1 Tax=Diadema antillarum TaxID=105358 RepID=UPI003A8C7E7E
MWEDAPFFLVTVEKFRYQLQWFLFNLTAAPSIIVTAFDLGYTYVLTFYNSLLIIYPTLIFLIEIFQTLIVVRFVHAVYPFFCFVIYVLFIVIYWAAGGTDLLGNPFIYPYVDFENYPSIAAATVVGVFLATLLAQAILKGLYALRVRCMARRSIEAIPATEAVPPPEIVPPTEEPVVVELETLTA